VRSHRALAERAAELVAERASHWIDGETERQRCHDDVLSRAMNLLDAWERIVDAAKAGSATRGYSLYDREKVDKALLRTALEDEEKLTSDELKFKAPTSMRDVEAVSHLWLDFKHPVRS
jgi:hypothetical protein